jgi:hypothetical protein
MMQPLCKMARQYVRKLNIPLLYDPAVTFLHMDPREVKTYDHPKTEHEYLQQAVVKIVPRRE